METKLTSATKEVIISSNRPKVLIGERINPTGKKISLDFLHFQKFFLPNQRCYLSYIASSATCNF